MLTGFLEPSGGTATVEGLDIRTQMNAIYANMGVCPQHDLLWEQLTGEEHLLFYGRLKGLKGKLNNMLGDCFCCVYRNIWLKRNANGRMGCQGCFVQRWARSRRAEVGASPALALLSSRHFVIPIPHGPLHPPYYGLAVPQARSC